MSELGWMMLMVGIVVGVVGLLQRRKLAKLNSVPYRRPAEIAQMGPGAGDAKGMVSTEGPIAAPQPLAAPMSGQPCLAFEISIDRKWEKEVSDGKGGTRTESGSDNVLRQYAGSTFQLVDPAGGGVWVDASKQPDAPLEKSHSNTERVGLIAPRAIAFGQMQFQVPLLPRDSRTVAFVGTERVLRPTGTLFALGQLEARDGAVVIGTPKGLLSGSLMLSPIGRAQLVTKTQRTMKAALGVAAVLAVVGLPMGIFGPHAPPSHHTTSASLGGFGAATGGGPVGRSIAVGATTHGELGTSGDAALADGDDYALALTAGQTVTIVTEGGAISHGTGLGDRLDVVTALRCNDAEVARDDDGAGNLNSRIVYTPTASGVCTVRVMGFGHQLGAYTLRVAAGDVPVGTDEASADAPDGDDTCARAVRCCLAANASNRHAADTCGRLATLPAASCASTLQSFRTAVRATHHGHAPACD